MIDILVYLFETYGYADACPAEPEQLARKLSAAGFEEDEIGEAIEWLSGLREIASATLPAIGAAKKSLRIYVDEEQACLGTECRGFLSFLENSGVLNASQREMIVERAMALHDGELGLSKFKVIVLMVLWQQKAVVDTLILDELLTDEVEDSEHWGEAISVH